MKLSGKSLSPNKVVVVAVVVVDWDEQKATNIMTTHLLQTPTYRHTHIIRDYNFDEDLVQVLESFYADSSSAVLLQNWAGEFFTNSVGVRQGCLLSPALFNIFLKQSMQEALEGYEPSVSIGGCHICNLRFADDIDLIAGNQRELQTYKI